MSLAKDITPDQSQTVIFNRLLSNDFPETFARIATAQSGHETGGWTSNVYLTDNNGFGYGWNGSSYSNYPSVEDSVDDFAGYVWRKVDQGKFPDPTLITDPDQWASLLKSVSYYTDSESNYSSGITRWINENLSPGVVLSGSLLIFGFLLFLLLRKNLWS